MSMTMKEVREANYDVFYDCESPSHDSQMQSVLRYLENISHTTNTDISGWKVLEVFKNPNSEKGFIHTDKNKINELFFAETARLRGTQVATVAEPRLKGNALSIVTGYLKQLSKDWHRQARSSFESEEAKMQHLYEQLDESRSTLSDLRKIIRLPPEDPARFVNQLQELLADDFWTLDLGDIGAAHFQFQTKPIVLYYKNSEQAVDLAVPMGQFTVRLLWGRNHIRVLCHFDNVMTEEHYHPHVDSNGIVCYGNMLADVEEALQERNYLKALQLTKAVLTNYCDDNPYMHLHDFAETYADMTGSRTQVPELPPMRLSSSPTDSVGIAARARAYFGEMPANFYTRSTATDMTLGPGVALPIPQEEEAND